MQLSVYGVLCICLFTVGLAYKSQKNIKDFYKICGNLPSIANATIAYIDTRYAEVTCLPGFKYEGDNGFKLEENRVKIKCDLQTGKWIYHKLPKCTLINTCKRQYFANAELSLFNKTFGVLYCMSGYYVSMQDGTPGIRTVNVFCQDGRWLIHSTLVEVQDCVKDSDCGNPPQISHASFKFRDGIDAYYTCEKGYKATINNLPSLTCRDTEWIGPSPLCVSVVSCMDPPQISHGRWTLRTKFFWGTELFPTGYPTGTEIQYQCVNDAETNTEYQLIGERVIQCVDGAWSKNIPECVDISAPVVDCQLPKIPNGECRCVAGARGCKRLVTGSKIECTCQEGYQTEGQQMLTCSRGKWKNYIPTCVAYQPVNYGNSNEISTNDSVSNQTHMNTLAIVIATACSVLGFLLMVMVVVVLRRRKPHHPRIYHTGAMPPPYTRVHSNTADEHDRVALIGYETARLPTYEEATRIARNSRSGQALVASSSDYRPLPNIPTQLSVVNNNNNNNNNNNLDNTSRQSVVTTSTVNRDGMSEIFGSIDTVNFSMSDASTSVTVDTLDSRTSRPSIASRTATAGSLETSRENLTTEDAPLLKNTVEEEDAPTVPVAEELDIRIDEEGKEV